MASSPSTKARSSERLVGKWEVARFRSFSRMPVMRPEPGNQKRQSKGPQRYQSDISMKGALEAMVPNLARFSDLRRMHGLSYL
jgi:hypothetical protein